MAQSLPLQHPHTGKGLQLTDRQEESEARCIEAGARSPRPAAMAQAAPPAPAGNNFREENWRQQLTLPAKDTRTQTAVGLIIASASTTLKSTCVCLLQAGSRHEYVLIMAWLMRRM